MTASMVVLGKDGVVKVKMGNKATLPPGYQVPEGCSLSWETHFMNVSCELETALLTHGKATVFLEPLHQTILARVESPVIQDFLEAIELTIRYVGGKVATFASPTSLSIALAKEDFKKMSEPSSN